MHPLLIVATLIVVVLQFTLPSRWAFLPLFIAACHLGNVEVLGNFTAVRLVIISGLARAMMKGEFNFSASNPLDRLFIILSVVTLISSIGHLDAGHNPYVERIGLVLNIMGSYLYARSFIGDPGQVSRLLEGFAIILIPLGTLMAVERATGKNSYFIFGARTTTANMRDGNFRAQGPFNHAILAGTVGATAVPLLVALRRRKKQLGTAGLVSAFVIVVASGSSGPLMALMVSLALLVFWRWRQHTRMLRLSMILAIIAAHFVMARPVWFLIARIDLVGGSTGWHRSKLIDSAIFYLDEWWLFGTDYTRHWMHTGVSFNPNHTDLTNYYIHLGVLGGLPLLLSLILILRQSFRMLGEGMMENQELQEDDKDEEVYNAAYEREFLMWCTGIVLVAHAVSFISISYFGQMFAILYATIGIVPGLLEYATESFEEEEEEPIEIMSPA